MFWSSTPPPPPPTLLESALALDVKGLLEHEALLHYYAGVCMILTGVCVIFVEVVLGMRAPYGKHADIKTAQYYGPKINAKAGWIFQECWSFLVPFALLVSGVGDAALRASWPNQALLAMYMSHYLYRAFVFPLRMRQGAPMPIGVCLLAAMFCVYNGYLQGRAWTALLLYPDPTASLLDTIIFASGVALWAFGLYINLDADNTLRNLRYPGSPRYTIPRGGAFEYVSGANYFGEIVEWCGYALAAKGALPAVAFAFFTFANTAPRAYHHHLWYKQKFAEYPKERRAVIPFVW